MFRFPAKDSFEEVVVFMIIEDHGSPTAFKRICSSGYHSGQTELIFSTEAKHESGGLSVAWLIENWAKWIYPNGCVENVKYANCYLPNHVGTT